MGVCKLCNHLIDDDPHVCPDQKYLEMRDRLIQQYLEEEEQIEAEIMHEGLSQITLEGLNTVQRQKLLAKYKQRNRR